MRVKTSAIDTRWHNLCMLRLEASITGVLLISLLSGAGDHQIGMSKSQLFGIDAPTDRIILLNLFMLSTSRKQTAQFLASQRMACVSKGNAKTTTDQGPHIAGIGVMSMNPVGSIFTDSKMTNQLIGQLIEIGPELFLTQITAWSETEPTN